MARPTKARISRLEAENQQLRQRLGTIQRQSTARSVSPGENHNLPQEETEEYPITTLPGPSDVGKRGEPSLNHAQSSVSRIYISANGDSSYHGLTSTLFDDAPTDRRGQMRPNNPQIPLEHVSKRLMGEAAYQSRPIL